MILSCNLEQLMRIHGNLSVSDLARLTGIPQPTLHHILVGSTKNPRKKSLEALADFFSVSIPQLSGETPLPNAIPEAIKEDLHISTIPIIQWDMLKNWPIARVNNLCLKEVLLDKSVADNSFALVTQDSSMEPSFPQNAILIFDAGKHPKDRDFVIAHVRQNDTIFFNRLFVDNNENYIKQNIEDGNAKLIKLNNAIDRILGTLIEVRTPY